MLILLSAISMGLETVPEAYDQFYFLFDGFFYFCQTAFAIEILIRLQAHCPNYKNFFKDFWNRFDFVVVALSFIPAVGAFIVVARLLRVIRLLRTVSLSDRLRGFADRSLDCLDEAIGAAALALILGYIFALSGYYLFSEIDPSKWGSLGSSAKSIFYLALLQDVPSFIDPLLANSKFSILFFLLLYFVVGFILLGAIHAAIVQSLKEKH